ncbi:MAG: hypothetical protein LJE89_08685 [Deltaproteobacteria bacterium]|nr:hypothetical protein [Deltaproteobacteria bacterium]
MIVKNKKRFVWGLSLGLSFGVILVLMFSPIFHGENGLQAADRLFNSIAKGSTNYFPDLLEKNKRFKDTKFEVTLKLANEEMAGKANKLMALAGVRSAVDSTEVKASGYLGQLVQAALQDSEAMFNNQEEAIAAKYGFPGKEVLFVWWSSFKSLDKEFKKQKMFAEASFLTDAMKKGVEVGYNFYGISPQNASSKAGILSLSLVFYVIYTLWWGYAILFLFEGVGMQMKKGAKKEV